MGILLAFLFLMAASLAEEAAPPKSLDQSENVQAHIQESDFIVDICIYEQEWIPATKEHWKAKLIKRAVVTGIHKGDIPVGTKLEYHHLIEEPPKLFKSFRSVVEGELKTFFFSRDDAAFKDSKYTIGSDAHFSFDRCKGDFAEAFAKELQTNPALKKPSE